jgi:prepilin-type N-terminal cleavage/methylation domain-containing protein
MKKLTLYGHQGFALIEIMVALILVSMIFALIPMGIGMSDRQKLEETIDEFDRAIRFAQNESILRNSIVRLHILLDKDPIEYSVQFGPGGNLVLPTLGDSSRMGIKEKESQEKVQKNLDSQFNKIPEFSEENKKLSQSVQIIGLTSSYLKEILQDGAISIYFYPTGDKDDALIYFSTQTELATLEIPAFENQTYVNFYQYSEAELASLELSQENRMKELYDKWVKN